MLCEFRVRVAEIQEVRWIVLDEVSERAQPWRACLAAKGVILGMVSFTVVDEQELGSKMVAFEIISHGPNGYHHVFENRIRLTLFP